MGPNMDQKIPNWFAGSNLTQKYLLLNQLLGETIFSGRFAGRAVYLTLAAPEQEYLAAALGCDVEDLGTVCSKIVCNVLHATEDPYIHITKASKKWRFSGQNGYPPFLALLFVLAHAAELMEADGELASNNYYVRLNSILSVDIQNLRRSARSTEYFWKLLSRWLIDNDFEFGRPTASSRGTWKYVGYPMSQALVRASDRNLLQNIFVKYNFTAADRVSIEEIKPYVDDWMRSSQPNTRLKSTWQKGDLRQRIYEVVYDSFYDWVDSNEHSYSRTARSGIPQRNLTLILSIIPSFLSKRLSLNLGQKNSSTDVSAPYFDAQRNEFQLGHHIYGTFSNIDPNPFGKNACYFSQRFEAKNGSSFLAWAPRLAIPLVKSELGSYWSEVSKCSIGIPHIILVRDTPKIIGSFEILLAEASTGEAKQLDGASIKGIPEGWRLYSDVYIIKSDIEVDQELQHLLPLSSEIVPKINEGSQIARGIWHSKSTIKIQYQSDKSPTKIELLQPSARESLISTETSNTRFVGMEPDVPDGTYTLNFYAESKQRFTIDFALRSADRPRPLHRQNTERIAYTGLTKSSKQPSSEKAVYVTGVNIITSEKFQLGDFASCPAVDEYSEIPRSNEQEIVINDNYLRANIQTSIQDDNFMERPCIERGFHYWICEAMEERVPMSTPLEMQCKQCSMNVLMRNRGKKQTKITNANLKKTKKQPQVTKSTAFIETKVFDHDLFYDAICYLGAGSIGNIERLTADHSLDLWSLQKLLTSYSDLGLLDLHTPQNSNYVKSWSVPEPAVLLLESGEFCLTGFRCDRLISEINNKVETLGGNVEIRTQADRPSKISIKNLDLNEVAEFVDHITDPLKRKLRLVVGFQETFARFASYLDGMEESLSEISIGGKLRNLQKFDTLKSKWFSTDDCKVSGAYRFDQPNKIYFYKHFNEKSFRGPYNIVKVMAARLDQLRLHSYDHKSKRFYSTLGAEPSGLLSRALVMSSDDLPKIENGQTIYSEVSEPLAKSILHQLYTRALF